MCIHLPGIQILGLSGIQVAFENQTIWHSTSFRPFEYQTSSVYWLIQIQLSSVCWVEYYRHYTICFKHVQWYLNNGHFKLQHYLNSRQIQVWSPNVCYSNGIQLPDRKPNSRHICVHYLRGVWITDHLISGQLTTTQILDSSVIQIHMIHFTER